MTCVWDSLILGLQHAAVRDAQDMTPAVFVKHLKQHNMPVRDVRVNGYVLREREVAENQEAVRELKEDNLSVGYLCSSSDPVLILVSYLFNVNIRVRFVSTDIAYSISNATHELHLSNSHTHITLLKVVRYGTPRPL